jgi:hypothetical protein
MMTTPLLAIVLSAAAVGGLIWAAFDRLEKVASPELRAAVQEWLRKPSSGRNRELLAHIQRLFNGFFGPRHFSFRCFWRSSLISLASVTVLALIFGASQWASAQFGGQALRERYALEEYTDYQVCRSYRAMEHLSENDAYEHVARWREQMELPALSRSEYAAQLAKAKSACDALPPGMGQELSVTVAAFTGLVGLLLVLSLINLFPDYLSLLESRIVLRWMTDTDSAARIFLLLMVDVVATALIIALSIVLVSYLFAYLAYSGRPPALSLDLITEPYRQLAIWLSPIFYGSFARDILDPSTGEISENAKFIIAGMIQQVSFFISILFLSTFSTSAWVLLYVVSSVVLWAVSALGRLRSIVAWLDIDSQPVRAVGLVAAALGIVLTTALLLMATT